jgi:hypothetical protein
MTIDFDGINKAALSRGRSIFERILPGGKFRSCEYVVLNPRRTDHKPGSFSINYRTGEWGDFATGDKGGDIISWLAYVRNVGQGDAARIVADMVGIEVPRSNARNGHDQHAEATHKAPQPVQAPSDFPLQTPPDHDGTPKFHSWGQDGPPVFPDDKPGRRHIYRRGGRADGDPVRIKIKKSDGGYINWYRVRNAEDLVGWQAQKPDGYVEVPYIGDVDPFDPEVAGECVYWPEGERDVDTVVRLGRLALTFGGKGDLPNGCQGLVAGRHVVILADNDDRGGLKHAQDKARLCWGIATSVKIVFFTEKDVSDWIAAGHGVDELDQLVEHTLEWVGGAAHAAPQGKIGTKEREWPEPTPIPNSLLPVDPFCSDFLPAALAPWVQDIADRLQCPADYVAVSAMTALGAVVGRRVGIKPQQRTDWVEIPNLWGAFIGQPGMLKSPAMGEALKPIHHLEAEAAKENEVAQEAYDAAMNIFSVRKSVNVSLVKAKLKERQTTPVDLDFGDEPQEPIPVRYRTNDSTYEGLGELLIGNPTGLLIERDELISLLKHLDREDEAVARGFYLTGWSGTQPYTFDRITRGHRHIEAVCLSVLGNTQPARIGEYVRRANAGGTGGDGLIQRFGLMVWPDVSRDWRNVDEYPNKQARDAAWQVFDRASKLDKTAVLRMGADMGAFDKVPSFRFEDAAHDDFLEWRKDHERRLRAGEMSPALEGHLAKYRKLVPALALLNHLADQGQGPVSHQALLRALAFAVYLETHARRVYGASSQIERLAGKAILTRIRKRDLKDGFTARDIHQRDWADLTDREHVQLGLNLLLDLDHIEAVQITTSGRPKVIHYVNPRTLA